MKRFWLIALCLLFLGITLWLDSCSAAPAPLVNLNFAGAGMGRPALEEIESLYQREHPNVVINSVFAGSAVIRKAIEQGEPFDGVFLAEYPPLEALQSKGLIIPESLKGMVTTDMVLIAPANSSLQVSSFRELADDRITTVAIGNANLAIGRYTESLLTHLGIAPAVRSKAVVVSVDVREVLMAVEQGEAEVGITFLSEARFSDKVKVLATAPKDSYGLIQSGVAVVKASAHRQEMQAYLDFLSSDRALAIFEKFGLYPCQSQKQSGDSNHESTIQLS